MPVRTILVAATAILLLAAPSQAATFQFYNPGALEASNCGVKVAGDCVQPLLEFSTGGVSIQATANGDGDPTVIQDLVGDGAGLGVFTADEPADNIQFAESLTIASASGVLTLTSGVFFDFNHNPNETVTEGADFRLVTDQGFDEVFALTPSGTIDFGEVQGTTFVFQALQGNGLAADPFYVSLLELDPVTSVPEPGTALLLGLGLVGLGSRRMARA